MGANFTSTATFDPNLGESNGLTRQLTGAPAAVMVKQFAPLTKLVGLVTQTFGGNNLISVGYGSSVSPRRLSGRYSNIGGYWSNLAFDGHGQLQSLSLGGTATNYQHDARGNRANASGSPSYTANNLDQLTKRNVSATARTVGVMGTTEPLAQLKVLPTNASSVASQIVTPTGQAFTADAAGHFLQSWIPGSGIAEHAAAVADFTVQASIVNANGVVTTYGYSPTRSWLTSISTVKGATTIGSFTYTRDNDGRITAVVGNRSDDSWTYGYDDLDRLLTATNQDRGPT